jgi:histidinol-phosphate aminotransferase
MKEIAKRRCLENITPYVPGKPVEEVERELCIAGVIKLASNENPLGPSPLALEAIREYLPKINYYPDGSCYYLKQALAAHLGLGEANIVFGNGADELITLVGAAYLNPGDEIIMADPSFSEYDFSARLMDARPTRVPLKDYRHDLKAMAAAVNDKTRVVFVCNPNNPTGTTVTHQELTTFLQKIPTDILVVLDEAYYEYVTDPDYPRSLELLSKHQNILILRTFSKVYGLAGLRIGYGLASEKIVQDLNTVREPFNVNAVAQVGAIAALRDQDHLRAVQELNSRGKAYLAQEFDKMGLFHLPTDANFVFLETRMDSNELFQDLMKKGVIVRTGSIFGYPQFIRVSIGTDEQNRLFIKALQETLAK